jgi:hypothetical protein
MSWEESFIRKAAEEKLRDEGVVDEKSEESEGVTIEPKNKKDKERLRRAQDELSEGQIRNE